MDQRPWKTNAERSVFEPGREGRSGAGAGRVEWVAAGGAVIGPRIAERYGVLVEIVLGRGV